VVFGSTLILKLIDRYPLLVVAGGGLLGWLAGDIAVGDQAIEAYLAPYQPSIHYAISIGGAIFVVALGTWLARRKKAAHKKSETIASEHHSAAGS